MTRRLGQKLRTVKTDLEFHSQKMATLVNECKSAEQKIARLEEKLQRARSALEKIAKGEPDPRHFAAAVVVTLEDVATLGGQ